MELQEFIENLSEVFEDTDTTDFVASTEFKNNDEWNSLLALSIIAMVDDEYNIVISGNDIKQSTTIEDLYLIVKSK